MSDRPRRGFLEWAPWLTMIVIILLSLLMSSCSPMEAQEAPVWHDLGHGWQWQKIYPAAGMWCIVVIRPINAAAGADIACVS